MEKINIPVYRMVIDPDAISATGVTCVSLVNRPAIESNFIALSKHEAQELAAINAEQFNLARKEVAKLATVADAPRGEVTGPLLIPDFQIYRLDDQGNPYFITFAADEIRKIAHKFSKGKWHSATNEEHSIPLGGNTMVELWIVEDPEKDKSAALGLTVPKGTWMGTMKIEDRAYFDAEILSGNRKGFSIEGWFEYAESLSAPKNVTQNLNMNTQQPPKGFLARLKELVTGAEKTAEDALRAQLAKELNVSLYAKADGTQVKCAAYTIEDGTMSIIVVDETKEAFYKTADNKLGEKVPDGDHKLNDGTTLVIADGLLTEIKPAETTNPATTPAAATADAVAAANQAALAARLGVSVAKLQDSLKLSDCKVFGKGEKLSARKTKLGQTAKKESLSIVTDAASTKPIFIDQRNGECTFIEDHGGYLWGCEYVPAGSYLLVDGSTLVVVEVTETVYDYWTEMEVEEIHSYVDPELTTTPVEVMVPWLKKATSEIAELAVQASTKLGAANATLESQTKEIEALKAQVAALKAQPAAKPTTIPPVHLSNKTGGVSDKAIALVEKLNAKAKVLSEQA